ncbi:MAG: outer-membrane lipoprotein carrier protein LolA [Prevotella sp.]|jgi:outer membrane lipoprotein-sorting protein|nr:outer-membrane lipoprotein carrier protein LolA [Prevotella sp.]
MRTKLATLSVLLFISVMASAQNARSILDKASEIYNQSGGITAAFTLDTKDTKQGATYSYDGKAYMKGDKFRIEIPDAITWFDGETQWVYVKDTEEVNVSNPTGDELQAISPSSLFSIYKSGFNLKYKGEKKDNTKLLYEIELTPENKNSEFSRIIVQIDKGSNMFHRITLVDKVGLENILTIKKYMTQQELPDQTFRFNKSDYPDVEVVDLR